MTPEAVISTCDAEGGAEVVEDGPEKRWARKWCAACKVEAVQGYEYDKSGIEPINLLVPVVK